MEPTAVSSSPPAEPQGNWVVRTWTALVRERRLPTRVGNAIDRVCIRLGCRTKTLRVRGFRVRVRRLASDEHFVRDILVDREYNPPGYEIHPEDVVIDIGGNIGAFALLAARSSPRGKVITVEPVRDSFRLLTKNVSLNHLDNVVPIQAAVSTGRGLVPIYLSDHGTGLHSLVPELASGGSDHELVEAIGLEDIFDQHEISRCDFLKLDCEGAEFSILHSLPAELYQRIEKVVLEYHVTPIDRKRTQSDLLVERLQDAGFQVDTYTDVVQTNRGMIYARRL